CDAVENAGGVRMNTVSGASWKRDDLVLALGVYGPPSVSRYQYPDPRTMQSGVAQHVPQRYSLIDSDNFILYPSLGAAYRITPWLDAGAVVQLRTFHVRRALSLFVLDIGGDVPDADAVATIDARDRARLSFGFGI